MVGFRKNDRNGCKILLYGAVLSRERIEMTVRERHLWFAGASVLAEKNTCVGPGKKEVASGGKTSLCAWAEIRMSHFSFPRGPGAK